ncbi:ABC transporter permease [Phyllobacterium sp. 22229]|uniref:ABC transporter permease n=1 Tax=Phyllobacterium myrsinacearum TaxID=28101 RepID=A0A2S9JQM0_9HYPH|nr:ABC transporter permease [Phyllobacterium myrsinacearum]PRD55517.1 ABC transporter permease [Phyllobacterium myrsinacearum]PWV91870.1 monosaccharide ABC transporter membrane protein (CUT2 family) [Phyllobacterium myrsinacearum]RZV05937.1 monosaccharide ABC transporter membrane protein (CUT2 family) [Phyllobacterium myrsinacearum]
MSDTQANTDTRGLGRKLADIDKTAVAPFLALAALFVLGALVNPSFIGIDNILNVLTRSSFIAIIAVGATFVISAGGLDLSVGSMAALVAGIMILFLNSAAIDGNFAMLAAGVVIAIGVGAGAGLVNGAVTTLGRIEPFIVTLGTMAIYRSVTVWLANGGSIAMKSSEMRNLFRPVYTGTFLGLPIPVWIILAVGLLGAFILYKTSFGRHVIAVGSNEDVARYSGIHVNRVRAMTYVIQGICVAIAVVVYVPRLGAATTTTGMLWELQAITAVVIGGTALKGGVGRIWGTICGAFMLEIVGNIMVLSNFVSEYLIGAVQGVIIIIAMLVQRTLQRKG